MPFQPATPADGSEERPDSTVELVTRARDGDEAAVEQLFARCLPALRRWAHGRLPSYARDLSDTQDLVQETLLHAFGRLPSFEARYPGALLAYLRQAVANRIRDELRRAHRRPASDELGETYIDPSPSPLEQTIGREGFEQYEAALQRLKPADREAIVARIELQQSFEEVAASLGKPSANAARVAVTRAVKRLIEAMDDER